MLRRSVLSKTKQKIGKSVNKTTKFWTHFSYTIL